VVDGFEPVNRETKDTLRLFAVSGLSIYPQRQAKDSVSFLSVGPHRSTSELAAVMVPNLFNSMTWEVQMPQVAIFRSLARSQLSTGRPP
jgi:hypothetical protein